MFALFAESLIVGGATGFFSGLLGVGGGFIMIPLLTVMGVPIHTAVGTCLAFVACASLIGLVQHVRQGSIDPLVALILTLPAALMANLAAGFSNLLAPRVLHGLFGALLVGILLMYHFSPGSRSPRTVSAARALPLRWYVLQRQRIVGDTPYQYDFHIIKAVFSGMFTGTLTGLFGIGGGVLLVPLAIVVLHMPVRVTAGTSLAVFILPSVVGAFTHWRLGNVDVGLWLPLVVAGIVGSYIGARCVIRVPPARLKYVFLLLVSAGAVFMMLKAWSE
jgi:uncharacterized membrane protein YfcA